MGVCEIVSLYYGQFLLNVLRIPIVTLFTKNYGVFHLLLSCVTKSRTTTGSFQDRQGNWTKQNTSEYKQTDSSRDGLDFWRPIKFGNTTLINLITYSLIAEERLTLQLYMLIKHNKTFISFIGPLGQLGVRRFTNTLGLRHGGGVVKGVILVCFFTWNPSEPCSEYVPRRSRNCCQPRCEWIEQG